MLNEHSSLDYEIERDGKLSGIISLQEFMVLPTGATCFSEAMRMGSELYHHLKKLINKKYGLDATAVGDEGGFAPNFQDNREALELLVEAIKVSGYEGEKVQILCSGITFVFYHYLS